MKINSLSIKSMGSIFSLSKSNKINRVALNALLITNCCALTSLFFVSSTALLAVSSTITIIGSALLIEKIYR